MDDSAARFVDQIKACIDRATDIVASHPDEFSGRVAEFDRIALVMDPGDRQQAVDMAMAANLAAKANPRLRLMLSVNVDEDDTRELDQIPAARDTLRTLAQYLTRRAFWRLSALEQAMILVAVGKAWRDGPGIYIDDKWAWLIRG
jgi:hypothetical protein